MFYCTCGYHTCKKSYKTKRAKAQHLAGVKAAKKKKTVNSHKNVDWTKAGRDAQAKKKRSEGLSNPEGKKEYYDVMNVYSKRKGFSKPICFCCKNSDWKFLVFDHIKNRPKSHKGISGVSMARKLKKDNYPTGIQILCHNCNTGKEIYGGVRCPHYLSKKAQKKLKTVRLPLGKIFRK